MALNLGWGKGPVVRVKSLPLSFFDLFLPVLLLVWPPPPLLLRWVGVLLLLLSFIMRHNRPKPLLLCGMERQGVRG